jgi:hypothetical protein
VGDMTVYGYARVSTDSQSLSGQLAELKAAKNAPRYFRRRSAVRGLTPLVGRRPHTPS